MNQDLKQSIEAHGVLENESELVHQYFQTNARSPELYMPNFAKITRNVLMLNEIKISEVQAIALKNFLLKSDSRDRTPHFNVRKLVINSCKAPDSHLARILEGLIPHRDHIKVICSVQNDVGPETVTVLDDIVPNLDELIISNPVRSIPHRLSLVLIQNCADYGRRLQRVSFSKFNLNDENIANQLCQMISNKPILGHLDISWT